MEIIYSQEQTAEYICHPNSLIENRFVTLKVFDVVGKEVTAFVNEKQSPGTYQVEFDGRRLPSGFIFTGLW